MLTNKGSYIIEYQLIQTGFELNIEQKYYNHYLSAYQVLVYYINEYILVISVYKVLALDLWYVAQERGLLISWETQDSKIVCPRSRESWEPMVTERVIDNKSIHITIKFYLNYWISNSISCIIKYDYINII